MTTTTNTTPARTMTRTTYGDIRNGDIVRVQGHRFMASNVRVAGRKGDTWAGGDVNTDDVIRFTGTCADADDAIAGTGYDGGTYGGYANVPVLVERAVG